MKRCTPIVLSLLATSIASADVITWSPTTAGFQDWSDPANWDLNVVPGPLDIARFAGGEDTIAHANSESPPLAIARLVVASGDNEIRLKNPGGLTVLDGNPFEPSLVVGAESAALLSVDVNPSVERSGFYADSVVVGDGGPGSLRLRAFGGSSDSIAAEFGEVRVGSSSPGRLEVMFGRMIADRVLVGIGADGFLGDPIFSSGTVEATDQLDLGYDDYGLARRMSIVAGTLNVGTRPGSIGVVDQTLLDVDGHADFGLHGTAIVNTNDVIVGGDMTIGTFADPSEPPVIGFGDGLVTIQPDGSLEVGGDLILGLMGSCDLQLATTARGTVGGSVDSFEFSLVVDQRTLAFLLESPSAANDDEPVLSVAFDAVLPEVTLRLAGDYVPAHGDRWILVEAGGVIEYETLQLPFLGDDLAWDVTLDDGRLEVAILGPEPSADVDGDGVVGLSDLLLVLGNWGACDGCPEDIDGDGTVALPDLLIVLAAWD